MKVTIKEGNDKMHDVVAFDIVTNPDDLLKFGKTKIHTENKD